eukprot:CAMPEP_0206153836 /NCGR_PEP_ID=MMETSP1474-20131121/926_1 /ASSEMBLY_ACC=CAM_ASM_001110 /TAXON_ID=97495 /ORGANISM="Imantonia sp., Strain RCC918" /LENGTH=198 /DNA_ID=CAMNT_0053551801 /DNA_START=25 /DNA_END=621 /DNA_ORIENTATION=-
MAIARARPISMGGFDQQALKPDGGRVSLIVKGTADLVGTLPAALRKEAADGVTGIIYAINDERLEIIAEGEVATLEPLAEYVEAKALSDGAECVQSWQLPGGGYSAEFPVVSLQPEMSVVVTMTGDPGPIGYYNRLLKVEAVFNRGLKITSKKHTPGRLVVDCAGASSRLKSFVRWCYNGPPLARAEQVRVEWKKSAS